MYTTLCVSAVCAGKQTVAEAQTIVRNLFCQTDVLDVLAINNFGRIFLAKNLRQYKVVATNNTVNMTGNALLSIATATYIPMVMLKNYIVSCCVQNATILSNHSWFLSGRFSPLLSEHKK